MFNKKGFTLIELIMIIVILAILAAVAIPKYVNLQHEAESAAEAGVVGGVRAGIHTYFADADHRDWPPELDDAAAPSGASPINPFFDNVLAQGGITSDWSKDIDSDYIGPASGEYRYDNTDGSFIQQQP